MSFAPAAFLAKFEERGAKLRAEDGKLKVSAPKGIVDDDLMADLRRHKEEILRHLEALAAGPPPLERIPRDGPLPLSFVQERLWFLQQFDPASPLFNLSSTRRFDEPVDVELLERCLTEIARRHESLRTTLRTVDGRPAQVVSEEPVIELRRADLGELEPAAAERELERRAREEARRPLDLAAGPLIRFVFYHLPGGRAATQATIHHAIADDWSGGVMYRELAALYAAGGDPAAADLPELRFQYADFADWQRRRMQGDVLASHLAYWRRQLAGLEPLELPTDRPRPPVQTHVGAHQRIEFEPALSERLARLARGERVTLFMALLAAFDVLLWRWSGQGEVVVGTPIGTRFRIELEPLIGNFINNLVLRVELADDPTFRQLLARMRGVVLDAFAHQELPFQELVEALQPARDMSRPPLFQVLFDFRAGQAGTDEAARGVRLVDHGAVPFELALYLDQGAEGLGGRWEYNTDLFDHDTVRRMGSHYREILAGAVADPDRPISRLPWLGEERERILATAGPAPRDYPRAARLEELVAERARSHPERTAVVAGEERLTYGELSERSQALARRLAALGVGPEVCVGLCLDRSVEMVVAVLAVLHAGGAYIPLDPAYPVDRLAYMVEDAGARIVLTQAELEGIAPRGRGVRLVAIDRPEELAAMGEAPTRPGAADNLAYVIYTSGSTGRPKGVQIPHRTVVNLLAAMRREPGFAEDETLLSVTTLSFDISVLELFLPLTTGARLVLASREQALDGRALAGLIAEHGATVLQATPTTWRLLLESGWEGEDELLALCGGEAMPRDVAEALVGRTRELWNMYGPTETTIWSSVERVGSGGEPVLLGPAIDNTALYVLDDAMEPVAWGVAGELYIGGEGLARGYRDRPAMTAERFVPDPFAERPGARLYRTGDLVRARPDGRFEFLGRIDHQIKIRGFRVELGEIETALARHPGIGQAVVVVRGDQPGDERLVGYVIPAGEAAPSVAEVREFLRGTLPEYMVPSAVLELERFPQTPNGKIDRRALPEPGAGRPDLEARFAAPEGELEQRVAALWREVLDLERVGRDDSFFDIGGHSLLMARLQGRVRDQLGTELSLVEMFEYPSVRSMASRLAAAGEAGSGVAAAKDRAARAREAMGRRQRAARSKR